MHITMNKYLLPAVIAIMACDASASCGSAFCSANTNWDTQGYSGADGLRIDLRYSYARADRLRAGTSRIPPQSPSGSDEEIEDLGTTNQVLNLDLEYSLSPRWRIALGAPLLLRDHSHTFDSSVVPAFTQQAKFTSLGDVRVVGRYRFDLEDTHFGAGGLRLGLKLPTGAIDQVMTPADPTGDPASPGNPHPLDRASQPGSGSTDLIVGAYGYYSHPGSDWGWFVSGQLQSAIAVRDDFRPGAEITLDLGLHYTLTPTLTGMLQFNAQHRERDSGSNANPASGGYSLHLSPGLSYELAPGTQLYGLLQVALRQSVNTDPAAPGSGQLTAPWSLSVGISHRY